MGTQNNTVNEKGFTIVEMIIVIVVIAILSVITIISYDAVRKNARTQTLTADLTSVASKLTVHKSKTGSYPITPALFNSDIEKTQTSGDTVFNYIFTSGTGTYCLAASAHNMSYRVTSANSKPSEGTCPI